MKKLLIGLLAVLSITSFADDCTISMWNNDGAVDLKDSKLLEKSQNIVSKKGLTLTVGEDSQYKVYFRGIGYMYEGDAPKVFTPAGVIASLKSESDKITTQSEDLLVLKSRESKRMQKLALKSLRKAIKRLPYCQ